MKINTPTARIVTVAMSKFISAQGLLVGHGPDGTAKIRVDGKVITGNLITKDVSASAQPTA